MQDLVESAQTSENVEPAPKGQKLRLLAIAASMLVPGSGHWILGDKKRALRFFIVFLCLLALYWPVRLPAHYWGMIFLIFLGIGLTIGCSCSSVMVFSSRARSMSKWWFLLTVPMAVAVACGIDMNASLRASGFRMFTMAAESMAPTLEEGDSVVVDSRYFHHHPVKDGDVVVIRHHGIFIVKRIAAMGGEQISSEDGQIVVNGIRIDEPYTQHLGNALPEMNNFSPITVPTGQLFVLGDNRDQSLDSRLQTGEYDFGTVLTKDLVGVPLYIFKSKKDRTGHWIN